VAAGDLHVPPGETTRADSAGSPSQRRVELPPRAGREFGRIIESAQDHWRAVNRAPPLRPGPRRSDLHQRLAHRTAWWKRPARCSL